MKKMNTEDNWAAKKAKLEELASEQTSADIGLVEARRYLERADAAFQLALERATTAEKKLQAARGKLGGE